MPEGEGKFVWYDLMTTDVAAASSFYHDVIGWDIKDSGMTHTAYFILSMGPVMTGGLMGMTAESMAAGAHPGWMGHIGVDDVEAYTARVAAAGGAVHRPPTDIPGIGRYAAVADPQGAKFILFQPIGGTPPESDPAALGHISWHELNAGKMETAFEFYTGLFGWTESGAVDMGPWGTYQMFSIDGQPSGGMMTKMPEMPVPYWLFYFSVDAVSAAAERVAKAGGKLLMEPRQVGGGGWIAQFYDPQGGIFAVTSRKP